MAGPERSSSGDPFFARLVQPVAPEASPLAEADAQAIEALWDTLTPDQLGALDYRSREVETVVDGLRKLRERWEAADKAPRKTRARTDKDQLDPAEIANIPVR